MFRIATTTALFAFASLAGCSTAPKAPTVADVIRGSLDQTGLKKISVTQDRDRGVVTLGGQVATDSDKAKADQIAHSFAGAQVTLTGTVQLS